MFFIILNHLLFIGDAFKNYPNYKRQLFSLHILTDWHNNGFILISGIVGYKTNKYSNLFYLWIMVFFYSFIINLFFKIFKKQFPKQNDISLEFFPIIFIRYWYFTAYIGMSLFLPIINKGISILTKNEFKLVIISTLGLFVFWRDLKNPYLDVFNMKSGNSMIWFLTYYLLGAYVGKYSVENKNIKSCVSCFNCILIYLLSSYLYIIIYIYPFNFGNGFFQNLFKNILRKMLTRRFDSFLKIAQSSASCLFFLQIKYKEKITKIICFLGPLVFGIYLIHNHPLVIENILRHIFDKAQKNLKIQSIIIVLLLKSIKIFVFCIIIDYLRFLLFNYLKIKKISLFFEKKIYQIFN